MDVMTDFKVGQFGKIGEHMVGFELSKRGWIIFYPPYDERTDIVAMKFRCKKCGSAWLNEHRIACLNSKCDLFEKPIKSINSGTTYKNKICEKCGNIEPRNKTNAQKSKCEKCNGKMVELPLCPKCKKEIKILEKNCSNVDCDSKDYDVVFRSIQVKSSHLVGNNKIAFNFKYQDLINDKRHFFIVYNRRIVNGVERHFYWVLTKDDFLEIKKTDTTAFKIYQNDRGHYSQNILEKFRFKEEEFYKLQEEKEIAHKEKNLKEFSELNKKQKEVDVFRKLE